MSLKVGDTYTDDGVTYKVTAIDVQTNDDGTTVQVTTSIKV